MVILEEYEHAVKRGATILAELVGYAANSDAYHTNAPPEDGRGVQRVMELALKDAGVAAGAGAVSECARDVDSAWGSGGGARDRRGRLASLQKRCW